MATFGFTGPSYQSRSIAADCQRTVNLYPEVVESGAGKNGVVLYGTPGLRAIAELPTGPVRGLFSGDGERMFAAGGAILYEVFPDGTSKELGAIGAGETPVQMFANGTQIFVVAGATGYIADGQHVYPVTEACMGAFLDGYFIALRPRTARFYLSALLDGTKWDELDFGTAEAQPDHVVSMLAAHRELWLFGQRSTEVFFNSGNADFPFERIGAGYIELGCVAPWSPARLDNHIYWLGGDDRGGGVLWRATGYAPERVSTHAVEDAWRRYARIDDAIAFPYVEDGHSFYVLNFPAAGATWVYDSRTGLWHERGYWDAVHGRWEAHRARCHCYAWNKHLVGDRKSGKIFEQALDVYGDDGSPIRRERTCPHISQDGARLYYHQLQVDMEVGVGLDGGVDGSDPQAMMQFSDDGGRTWSNERWASMGRAGEYKRRVIWRRLGQARDRVFRVAIADPVRVALIDAHLLATPAVS